MKKFQFLSIKRFLLRVTAVALLFGASSVPCMAVEPIAGLPNLSWGMSPAQVMQAAPGQLAGQMLIYQTDYFSYPSVGQYYFGQEQLRYIMMVPRYTYEKAENWTPEYQRLRQELIKLYGEPTVAKGQQCTWKVPNTQTLLVLQPNGWMVRYDYIPPAQEGGK